MFSVSRDACMEAERGACKTLVKSLCRTSLRVGIIHSSDNGLKMD